MLNIVVIIIVVIDNIISIIIIIITIMVTQMNDNSNDDNNHNHKSFFTQIISITTHLIFLFFTGCSLLHWAALNNRVRISQYLINHGAIINISGGILGESPLQWAIRRKYYCIVQLLIVKGN